MAWVSLAPGCGRGSDPSLASSASPPSTAAGTGAAPAKDRIDDLPALPASDAITRARRIALVTTRGSTVVEGAPGTPFTRTEFQVERLIKGSLAPTFVVQVIGGRMGNVTVESPVQAFVKDHRYILLLGDDGPAGPTINPQAIFEVTKEGSAEVVRPSLVGIPILAAGSAEPAKPSSSGQRLDDVVFSILQFLKD